MGNLCCICASENGELSNNNSPKPSNVKLLNHKIEYVEMLNINDIEYILYNT